MHYIYSGLVWLMLLSLTVHMTNYSTRLIWFLRHHMPLITDYKQAYKTYMCQAELHRQSCTGARPTLDDTSDTHSNWGGNI